MWTDTSVFRILIYLHVVFLTLTNFAVMENDALVLLYINEIEKNIKKGPWEYLQWLRVQK